MDILRRRLSNQWLLEPSRGTPADVVRSLGAVQAQDYGGAAWAVGQRAVGITRADVDGALADGSIIRTHVLRPTWHLVTPADIRWMLALTAPRVKALAAYGNRQSGLDAATIRKGSRVLATALRGGRQLTRVELTEALRRAGIEPRDALGFGRLTLAAELDGVVCSGALRGKQQTWALLDERVPRAVIGERDALLAELAGRYMASHGPATIKDFAWWSGLSAADAGAGVRGAAPSLESAAVDGAAYWFAAAAQPARNRSPVVRLLPNFDEYTVGYADRSLLIDAGHLQQLAPRPDIISNNVVTVDGRVAGLWRRRLAKTLSISITMFTASQSHEAAITAAVQRHSAFLERPAESEIRYP